MHSSIRKDVGFTLVELLVVIAIIGILVALLLPAIQSAREAARRSQCQNNLKQLALGCLNHESSAGALPAGTTTTSSGRDVFHTWASYIMPFMEQGALFDNIDFSIPSWGPHVRNPRGPKDYAPWVYTPLAIHQCPSDLGPGSWFTGDAAGFTHSNYMANSGTRPWYQKNDPNNMGQLMPQNARGPFEKEFTTKNKGIELRRITDGTSNTVMLGEIRLTPGNDSRGVLYLGTCFYNHRQKPNVTPTSSNDFDSSEWCSADPFPDMPCTTRYSAARGPYETISRSQHPGGVQVAYCDGHAEFINDDIERYVWHAISSRAGDDQFASTVISGNGNRAYYVPLP